MHWVQQVLGTVGMYWVLVVHYWHTYCRYCIYYTQQARVSPPMYRLLSDGHVAATPATMAAAVSLPSLSSVCMPTYVVCVCVCGVQCGASVQ